MTAAQAFGACIKQGGAALPASVAADAGTQQVLAACAAERATLDAQFEAWVAGPTFPEAGRATAREQYKAQMSSVRTQVAGMITSRRAAPDPAPRPTPAPGK